jgi:hypothetical protein
MVPALCLRSCHGMELNQQVLMSRSFVLFVHHLLFVGWEYQRLRCRGFYLKAMFQGAVLPAPHQRSIRVPCLPGKWH